MSYNWMLAVPAWGDYHVATFVDFVLPSVKQALTCVKGSVRFVIHTDQPKVLSEHLDGFAVKFFPMPPRITVTNKPGKTKYVKLGDAERAALQEARQGECVGLIYGDTVVSKEFFSCAERHFKAGKKLLMMQGPRVLDNWNTPIGAEAKALSSWAWEYRHPWSDECTWNEGNSKQPAVLYFKKNRTVVSRGFMLYSFAMIKDRELSFGTLTADHGAGISSRYHVNEIYVATSCDEVACASMTPRTFSLGLGSPLSVDSVVAWAKERTVERNHWMFKHRCWMVGSGEADDGPVCDEILRRLQ